MISGWRSRKPRLTKLTQTNGVSGLDTEEKLRYDMEYMGQQSFWFDVKIAVQQLGLVLEEVREIGHS